MVVVVVTDRVAYRPTSRLFLLLLPPPPSALVITCDLFLLLLWDAVLSGAFYGLFCVSGLVCLAVFCLLSAAVFL